MKQVLFEQIVDEFNRFRGLSRDAARMLINKYPAVDFNTIHSIVSTEVLKKLKKSYVNPAVYGEKYKVAAKARETPGILVRLAAKSGFPPTSVARHVLHYYFPKPIVSKYMKDPTLIEDPDLAYEIYLSILYDDKQGFMSDTVALAIGYEYEIRLENFLKEKNIEYKTEDELRNNGYDKTPDVKLELPIAVDGFIINWIESKARFGSPYIHRQHIRDQFLSYWNRFGPGLVIYWFGFVDELADQNENRFIIMDHFPENIFQISSGESDEKSDV